ncbi:hypothetical protein TPHA_0H00690 [Tetrapisispora phaffii CBS 4417]|uniref:GPI mannosyltransferase 2 n=1 Tax=Tetrapisispora phaffii (strain ATCC 24235 / CBS 4417 / NBRC 1672 / NRRL Y-8282 / UCD 70-5) TaxID=1071381 RepID=G8BWX5_TETPH|nr:hypothetical protein TPHA_0H00690 [Tetrapisispora phaffii CBS 4417]CCE64279.1 hypothetical protein TPHA_0H00690 [Tetrapisispora phaffii CBS 4417]
MVFIVKLTWFFLLIKALQYSLVYFSPSQFDTSTELLLKQLTNDTDHQLIDTYWNSNFYNKLLSWDSVFFLKAIVHEKSPNDIIKFEHEYAFSNIWSKLIYVIDLYIHGPLSITGKDMDINYVYRVIKVGLVVGNIIFYLSSILLYYLTILTFSNHSTDLKSKKIAEKTAFLFIISSVSGFIISIYSEPLSFMFAFIGLITRELSLNNRDTDKNGNTTELFDLKLYCWPLYVIATSLSFIIAMWNRTNCIFLGIYFLFDVFQLLYSRKFYKMIFFPLLSGILLFTAFIYKEYYVAYYQFCPERGEWCTTSIIDKVPFLTKQSFYNFIQTKYWNIGFLNYWTLNNIPNFLFALPNIIILITATIYFTKKYPTRHITPTIWITRCFLLVLIFFAHVQIINRVFSFIPIHLWFISDKLYRNEYLMFTKKTDVCHEKLEVERDGIKNMNRFTSDSDDKIIKFYLYWLLFWVPLQTIFFASFLPPA